MQWHGRNVGNKEREINNETIIYKRLTFGKANGKKFKKPMNKKRYYQKVLILSFITRLVNITAMND